MKAAKAKEAIPYFTAALRGGEHRASSYFQRGMAHGLTKQHQKAADDFSQLLRLEPRNAFAYYNRGLAYQQLHFYPKSARDFDVAIRIDPEVPFFFLARAQVHLQQGHKKQADADLRRGLQVARTSVKYRSYQKQIENLARSIRSYQYPPPTR